MKNPFQTLTIIIIFISINTFGQKPIDIIDSSLSIHKKETGRYYCGLAEGDKLVFSFEETNGKDIDEINISEYLSTTNVLYKDYFKSKVTDKTINISKTGIYQFDFINKTSPAECICKFKIQRIPASKETKKFNTKIFTRTKSDTAFVFNTEKYLISSDTVIVPIIKEKTITVQNKSNTNSNRSYIPINIPAKTISWSYYIGVGKKAENMFNQTDEKAQAKKAQLKSVNIDSTRSISLALIALRGSNEFSITEKSDTIKYWFVRFDQNLQNFLTGKEFTSFEKGDGTFFEKRLTFPTNDSFYICLENDNLKDKADVHIKIYAVTVNEKWGEKKVPDQKIRKWIELYLNN